MTEAIKKLEDKRDKLVKQLQELYKKERLLKQKINQTDVLINEESKKR